ncbi:MAG: sulfite exporter TauE/SafE family protein [Mycobacteriales bacterium]
MDFVAVLLTGLLAGGISCTAVHGGLLAGLLSRQKSEAEQPDAPSSYFLRRSDPLRAELAPVGAFLTAKLLSHTLLGAALGALGSAAEVSIQARSWLQLAAGTLVISFGLAQLNVPGFRRIAIRPPTSWAQALDSQTWAHTTAPALLGAATVLLPCGVTVSVQALALASGSAPRGAALMVVFVLGTSPVLACSVTPHSGQHTRGAAGSASSSDSRCSSRVSTLSTAVWSF